ncbi:MAG: ATP-binding cassette domain-containing protein [Desulfobacterales bacterium]|jgi:peptide/nickel transport system ATP-binding protein
MTREAAPIIELEAVLKTYRRKKNFLGGGREKEVVALNRISLSIRQGEIFGLVGESGSGKTTAGRLIVKLEEPDSGRLIVRGKDLADIRGPALREFRRQVQMIFQDPYQSLNPYMSVYDTVCEPLIIHRLVPGQNRRQKVVETLAQVGLNPPEEFLNRFPHQLSGGQRQRVAIARATVLDPVFIVADEPTSMLDASISVQIFTILVQLREKLGATFLFITHSLAAALYLCDRIAVIRSGEIVETGPAKKVIRDPQHPYTRELIRAQPRFRRTVTEQESPHER